MMQEEGTSQSHFLVWTSDNVQRRSAHCPEFPSICSTQQEIGRFRSLPTYRKCFGKFKEGIQIMSGLQCMCERDYREPLKVTLFVFLLNTWTKSGPVTFNCSWIPNGLLWVFQKGSLSIWGCLWFLLRRMGPIVPETPGTWGISR